MSTVSSPAFFPPTLIVLVCAGSYSLVVLLVLAVRRFKPGYCQCVRIVGVQTSADCCYINPSGCDNCLRSLALVCDCELPTVSRLLDTVCPSKQTCNRLCCAAGPGSCSWPGWECCEWPCQYDVEEPPRSFAVLPALHGRSVCTGCVSIDCTCPRTINCGCCQMHMGSHQPPDPSLVMTRRENPLQAAITTQPSYSSSPPLIPTKIGALVVPHNAQGVQPLISQGGPRYG